MIEKKKLKIIKIFKILIKSSKKYLLTKNGVREYTLNQLKESYLRGFNEIPLRYFSKLTFIC